MTTLFFETTTKTLVSIRENTRLQIDTGIEVPPADTPHIDESNIALRSYDVHILDSLKSGNSERTSESGIYASVLKPLFEKFQIRCRYHGTDSKHSIKTFAESLVPTSKPTLVIVISGDTSVNELINSVKEVKKGTLKLFIIPAGTGNSLALSIGFTNQVRAISRLMTHMHEDAKPLNLYEARFPENSYFLDRDGLQVPIKASILFLVVASWAFHASLVADSDTEEMRKHGLERFQIAARQNLSRPQRYLGSATLVKGGDTLATIDGPFAYFVLTPSQKFEPKFVISPHGNIFDSNLYLVCFAFQENESYILDIMGQVYDEGDHVNNKLVRYECLDESTKLLLHLGSNKAENRRFCIDGAIVVVPDDVNEDALEFSYFGASTNGWDVEIIN